LEEENEEEGEGDEFNEENFSEEDETRIFDLMKKYSCSRKNAIDRIHSAQGAVFNMNPQLFKTQAQIISAREKVEESSVEESEPEEVEATLESATAKAVEALENVARAEESENKSILNQIHEESLALVQDKRAVVASLAERLAEEKANKDELVRLFSSPEWKTIVLQYATFVRMIAAGKYDGVMLIITHPNDDKIEFETHLYSNSTEIEQATLFTDKGEEPVDVVVDDNEDEEVLEGE
jgi:hypothetical protein